MLNPKISAFFRSEEPKFVQLRKIAAAVIFGALVLALVFTLPWPEIFQVLRETNFTPVIFALLLILPSMFLTAASLGVVMRRQDIFLHPLRILSINLTISFYEIVIPATLFGSGLRWYRFSKATNKPAEAFAAITYYKVFNTFLAVLLSFGFLFLTDEASIHANLMQLVILLVVIAVLLLLVPWISQRVLEQFNRFWQVEPTNRLARKGKRVVISLLQAFTDFEKLKLRHQVTLVLLGLGAQLLQLISYILIAKGIGIELTFAQFGALRALTLLASNLPINLSPGVGMREISLAALLIAMGVSLEYASAMSLLVFARAVFAGLIGGVVEAVGIIRAK
jgi:uncharacterized protein (TIRG00374 family)